MADRRRKNEDWYVAAEDGALWADMRDGVMLAVLMDLRDELQAIKGILLCHNMLSIPRRLEQIERNTRTTRKRKRARSR